MQSVQFQNLDRIVRNSTEKEQKKQSDGESFLDIMKKAPKDLPTDQKETVEKDEQQTLVQLPGDMLVPGQQILPLMSEVVPQPEAVQIVIPTQTEVPTENVQTVASGFVDAEMPVEEIDPLMMVMPFGQTEMESGDGVMPGIPEQPSDGTNPIEAAGKNAQTEVLQSLTKNVNPAETAAVPKQGISKETSEQQTSPELKVTSELQTNKMETVQNSLEVQSESTETAGEDSLLQTNKMETVQNSLEVQSESTETAGEDSLLQNSEKEDKSTQSVEETPYRDSIYEGIHSAVKAPQDTKRAVPQETIHVSQPEELPKELTKELVLKTTAGQNEFEIQITPKHLGDITVRVLHQDGMSVVSIVCSEKKTMELLAQSAKDIGAVMEQNLGKPTEIYVEKHEGENFWQEQQENDHAGRESEQQRQREQQEKMKAAKSARFLQELRLGLTV